MFGSETEKAQCKEEVKIPRRWRSEISRLSCFYTLKNNKRNFVDRICILNKSLESLHNTSRAARESEGNEKHFEIGNSIWKFSCQSTFKLENSKEKRFNELFKVKGYQKGRNKLFTRKIVSVFFLHFLRFSWDSRKFISQTFFFDPLCDDDVYGKFLRSQF